MIVSITQFASLAIDLNGCPMPLGKDRIACQVRTSAGAFTALNALTRFIRVATDAAIYMDITGGTTTSADEYFPAGSVEYLAVNGGETMTIAAA
jgi:hypothetical protein